MRTIRTKVYQFSELGEQAKQKAIEVCSDYNVDYGWWESVYEDAENIGLKITGFDIDRASYCNGDIIGTHEETARLILENHGEQCETYKTAKNFLADYYKQQDLITNDTDGDTDSISDLEDEFLKSLLEDYRIILSEEYDYLTSKAAIIETIEANKYEFKADGTRF